MLGSGDAEKNGRNHKHATPMITKCDKFPGVDCDDARSKSLHSFESSGKASQRKEL